MVFFSSCAAVKYYHELLNYIDVPVQCIHVRDILLRSISFLLDSLTSFHSLLSSLQGKQKQQKRTTTFFQFCQAETGILLCTDVAARWGGECYWK